MFQVIKSDHESPTGEYVVLFESEDLELVEKKAEAIGRSEPVTIYCARTNRVLGGWKTQNSPWKRF